MRLLCNNIELFLFLTVSEEARTHAGPWVPSGLLDSELSPLVFAIVSLEAVLRGWWRGKPWWAFADGPGEWQSNIVDDRCWLNVASQWFYQQSQFHQVVKLCNKGFLLAKQLPNSAVA